jgi:hypothetical protein
MRFRIVAGYSDTIGGDSTRLHELARELTSRKVLRFLDPASLAPFVAAATVYRRAPVADPSDVALYTVGGWDGDMPDQPFVPDGSPDDDARLSRHILEEANPATWLRMLSNNPLCQVSISERFRGPNAHLVGGAAAARDAITVAAADLASGAARQALVVAYETRPGHRNAPSGRAPTRSAALSLAESAGHDVLPELLAAAEKLAVQSDTALDVIAGCLAELADTPTGSGR